MPIGQAYRNGIKSIQRGFLDTNMTGSPLTITIAEVNVDKSVLIFTGAGASAVDTLVGLKINSPTSLHAVRSGNSGTVRVGWQVVEYY